MANEHLFFAQFLADPQHPYSSWKRKISHLIITSFTFLLIVFVAYYHIDGRVENAESNYLLYFSGSTFITTALIISPVVLILDELFYIFVVCPCCVNRCSVVRYSSGFVSFTLQLCALSFGIGCFVYGVYLASKLAQTSLQWLIERVVMGLLVYPIVEKLIIFLAPFIPLPVGCRCRDSCYLVFVGNWYIEKKNHLKGDDNVTYCEVLGGGGFGGAILPV